MRADHQVVVFDLDAVHRRHRQVGPQGLPLRAIVERHEDPLLGAEEQQTLADLVFTNRARKVVAGNAGDDLRPALAVVGRLVDVRRAVTALVAIAGQVGGTGRVW